MKFCIVKQIGCFIFVTTLIIANCSARNYSKDFFKNTDDSSFCRSTCKDFFATCSVTCKGKINPYAKGRTTGWLPSCKCTGIAVQECLEITIDNEQSLLANDFINLLSGFSSAKAKEALEYFKIIIGAIEQKELNRYDEYRKKFITHLAELSDNEKPIIKQWKEKKLNKTGF